MLNIAKNKNDDKLTVELTGRLDTNTAPQFEGELQGELENLKELIIDTKSLEYISSAGLRVLLSAQKSMNKASGEMKVINVSEEIMEIFEVTGFSDILTIE